jgi:hypothetical protein
MENPDRTRSDFCPFPQIFLDFFFLLKKIIDEFCARELQKRCGGSASCNVVKIDAVVTDCFLMFLKTQQDVLYKITKVKVLLNTNTFLEA